MIPSPEAITNALFRHYLREASVCAEHASAAPAHMTDWHAEQFRKNFRKALEIAGLSLIRTEDVIAATKIVEKADA